MTGRSPLRRTRSPHRHVPRTVAAPGVSPVKAAAPADLNVLRILRDRSFGRRRGCPPQSAQKSVPAPKLGLFDDIAAKRSRPKPQERFDRAPARTRRVDYARGLGDLDSRSAACALSVSGSEHVLRGPGMTASSRAREPRLKPRRVARPDQLWTSDLQLLDHMGWTALPRSTPATHRSSPHRARHRTSAVMASSRRTTPAAATIFDVLAMFGACEPPWRPRDDAVAGHEPARLCQEPLRETLHLRHRSGRGRAAAPTDSAPPTPAPLNGRMAVLRVGESFVQVHQGHEASPRQGSRRDASRHVRGAAGCVPVRSPSGLARRCTSSPTRKCP